MQTRSMQKGPAVSTRVQSCFLSFHLCNSRTAKCAIGYARLPRELFIFSDVRSDWSQFLAFAVVRWTTEDIDETFLAKTNVN